MQLSESGRAKSTKETRMLHDAKTEVADNAAKSPQIPVVCGRTKGENMPLYSHKLSVETVARH